MLDNYVMINLITAQNKSETVLHNHCNFPGAQLPCAYILGAKFFLSLQYLLRLIVCRKWTFMQP